jgi:3-phenylpropionate/trans-cinnamate dioxygenase ferredoxin subunit
MYNYKTVQSDQLEYVTVANVDELPNGERILIDIDGEPIAVFNIAGQYFAIMDVCSHDDGPVAEGELNEFEIICPRHGAHFDVRDGKALTLPAVVDIPAYPVRVEGDAIQLGLPLQD